MGAEVQAQCGAREVGARVCLSGYGMYRGDFNLSEAQEKAVAGRRKAECGCRFTRSSSGEGGLGERCVAVPAWSRQLREGRRWAR